MCDLRVSVGVYVCVLCAWCHTDNNVSALQNNTIYLPFFGILGVNFFILSKHTMPNLPKAMTDRVGFRNWCVQI